MLRKVALGPLFFYQCDGTRKLTSQSDTPEHPSFSSRPYTITKTALGRFLRASTFTE